MAKKLKVRWAIDPFSDDLKSWRRVWDIAKILSKDYELIITPTYMLSKDISGFFGNYVRLSRAKIKKRIEGITNYRLEKFPMPGLEPIEVKLTSNFTRRSDAKAFAEILESEQSDLVIVTKSKRSDLGEYVLGSFLSSLLSHSTVPIFLLPSRAKKNRSLDKAFFPTDLSKASLNGFKKLTQKKVSFARDYLVYHRLYMSAPEMVYDLSYSKKSMGLSLGDSLKNRKAKAKKELNHLIVRGKFNDLDLNYKIDENNKFLPQSIIDNAVLGEADYLVVPTFVNKTDSLFVGSVAKEVISLSNIPLLVWKGHRR